MTRFLSIRHRLMLIIVAASTLGLLVAGAGFITLDQERQRVQMETRLITLASAVGTNSAAALAFEDVLDAEKTLAAFSADNHIVAAGLYTRHGRLAVYTRAGTGPVEFLPAAPDPAMIAPSYTANAVLIQSPVILDGERMGTVVLVADLEELAERRRQLTLVLLAVLAASLVVAVIVGSWLQRSTTLPLEILTGAVRGFGEGRASAPLPASGQDEVGVLARAFNTMVENLRRTTVSKNYVDNILLSMSDTLIVVAPDGTIRTVNRAACELLGYSGDELVGRPFGTILEPAPGDERNPAATTGDEAGPEERVYIARDGRRIPVSLTRSVMSDESGVQGYVCVAQDVTARLEQEEIIRDQNEKLAVASRMSALGEMAAGVAHEINNPLAIILGRAGQLRILSRRGRLDEAAVLEVADKIENTVIRCTRVVNGMRLFSRDAQNEPLQETGLRELVDDTMELCRERFRYHGVSLEVDVPEAEVVLQCRVTQVGQVILNLLNNAFDAVEEAAEKRVRVSAVVNGDRLFLTVSNSGATVPEEIRDKIFQPFFSTKGVGKGTGLGLSISKGIVESHGGTLRLASGDTPVAFEIELPLRQDGSFAPGAEVVA